MQTPFTQTETVAHGVRYITKGIPGVDRPGVLAPEILADLQAGTADVLQAQRRALATGDYYALRQLRVPSRDVTTQPVGQWEFAVPGEAGDIPVTAYCAEAPAPGPRPAVVYFHGGGWRMGSRADVEHPLRLLAQLSGAAVFSVGYRLAPEWRFPAATNDCWRALRAIYRQAGAWGLDRQWITVAGDSAGGNMAAACARRDRNMRTGMVRRQVLVYPVLAQAEPQLPGYRYSVQDYTVDPEQAQWIVPCIEAIAQTVPGRHMYTATEAEDLSPDASPLLDPNLKGLPPTLLLCAEFDYLARQADAYARRLAAAGVPVTVLTYRGTNHGFFNHVGYYPQAADAVAEMAAAVTKATKPE